MTEIKASDLQGSDELYLHREIIVDKGQKSVRIDKFLLHDAIDNNVDIS